MPKPFPDSQLTSIVLTISGYINHKRNGRSVISDEQGKYGLLKDNDTEGESWPNQDMTINAS